MIIVNKYFFKTKYKIIFVKKCFALKYVKGDLENSHVFIVQIKCFKFLIGYTTRQF